MDELKVEDDFKLCELKRENLCKALEKITSQASDLLVFGLQWKDLEFHLMSTEAKVEKRFKELMVKEMELQNRSLTVEEAEVGGLEMKADGLKREIKGKEGDLSVLRMLIEEHTVKLRSKTVELDEVEESLRGTQNQLDLREEELVEIKIVLDKYSSELSAVMKNFDKGQTRNKELEEEIDRKGKNLASVLDEIGKCEKQLELVEKKLDSQKKLFERQSLDLDLKDHKIKSLDIIMEETCRQIDSKAKELEDMEILIEERNAQYESIKDLVEEHTEELDSKEKKQNAMTKAIQKLSLEIVSKEKALKRAEVSIQQLSEKQHSEKKKLDSTKLHLERCIAEVDSKNKELVSVKDSFKEYHQKLKIKEKELKSRQSDITEINKRVEEGEKKLKRLDNSNEELIKQLQVKQEKICSINKEIRECSGQRDQVKSSIYDLTAQLKSKERDLNSVKKKIQESLKDYQSKEDEKVRLKATLMEREQELGLREKQFDARSEEIQLKEKELDKKDQQLKSAEQKLAICVKDYEQKAKALSCLCQQSNPDQHVDVVQDGSVNEEKTLKLFLHGHLKKCQQLHVAISRSLKTSSDPTKLVLDTIQGLYSTLQKMEVTNLGRNTVRRSSICLLECLMDMSLEPKTEVQEEAIKFAIECKNTTVVKEDNPMEVLNFLHFLAAFSLAYNFDTDKVQNLFDDVFLRKYAPCLCKALGLSALTPVNSLLSLDDKPEQHPLEAAINNSIDSHSPVQENIASPHLGSEGVLGDYDVSSSFSPNEVSTGLPFLKDPGRFVLSSVEDALIAAHQRGELGLAEPLLKNLVPLLEELTRIVRSIDLGLQSDAVKVAHRWGRTIGTKGQISPLETWGFLHFIVAYGLVKQTKQEATLHYASYVSHFRQAPKLFQNLGLTSAIPNFVNKLINERKYIPAIRFIFFFNLKYSFSPLEFLKTEIISLRHSSKESQVEDKDVGKLRDIIELSEDLKLEMYLPVDLIVKFMVPKETQNQNQCVVPVQPPQILAPFHMQASNPHVEDVKTYQDGGSTAFQGQSSYQTGVKRPRVDPLGPRPVVRPCLRPPSGY